MSDDRGPRADTWIALLRAVNVGRTNRIGMDDLRASLEAMGYDSVRTYVQSGNVVFTAPATSSEVLAAEIHDRLAADFAIDVIAIVLSAEELASIAGDNPLLGDDRAGGGMDIGHLHVLVLDGLADRARFDALSVPAQEGERAVLLGRAIYLELPFGVGRTKLSGAYFERALGLAGTARNWRTVNALVQLTAEAMP